MTTVTLEEAKEHLHVDHDAEDSTITRAIAAAEAHIADYLGDDLPEPMPATVRAAVLLLVGDLFENRERQTLASGSFRENPTFHLLLNPHRSAKVL